jgi:YD repeat-containing protein
VTSIDLKNSSNSTLASHAYTCAAVSNVLTRTDDSVTTTFTYDVIDRRTSESRTGYSAPYTYDANGNRASKTLNGSTQTYVNDSGDKLTGVRTGLSQVKSFTYDAAGRTTAITESGVTTNFSYD